MDSLWSEKPGTVGTYGEHIEAKDKAMTDDTTQPQGQSVALEPCPFCGSDAKLEHFTMNRRHGQEHCWYCSCTNEDDCDASISVFVSAESAIAAWNRRDAARQQAAAELAQARERIAALEAEVAALRRELAETYGECIEFVDSYGIGDEEWYEARYRELTGHGYMEEGEDDD